MKKIIFSLIMSMAYLMIQAQNFDVSGNARISGKLEIFNAALDSSIFIGTDSGKNDDGDNSNVFLGYRSGATNTSGKLNVFLGHQAGEKNTTGSANTYIGFQAGIENQIGQENVFIGFKAGRSNTSGSENTIIGYEAGLGSSTGNSNTLVGFHAGDVNEGDFNTFIGENAGSFNTSGTSNTFLGSGAGAKNELGNNNTFLGALAGTINSSGKENTLVGHSAGLANTKGELNTFLGFSSGLSNQTGNNNTFLGYAAGFSGNGSGNVFLGFQAGFNETGSNKLYIDNSSTSTPLIHGNFSTNRLGINRVATTNTLEVGGDASKATAGSWLGNSDIRLKKNIVYLNCDSILQKVVQMKGVSYEWDDSITGLDRPEGLMYGFIAQDLQQVWPNKVSEDSQGYLQTAYGDFDPMLIEAIKALAQQNQDLKKQLQAQANRIYHLECELEPGSKRKMNEN